MSNQVHIQNPNLENVERHDFYHFMIDSKSTDLEDKFGDIKFVVMGGKIQRMQKIAQILYDVIKGKNTATREISDPIFDFYFQAFGFEFQPDLQI